MKAEAIIAVVIVALVVISVIIYVISLKNRKEQAAKMLAASRNNEFDKHYGDYIRANMKTHKWAVPEKLPYGSGAVVTKSTRTYDFSEISSYQIRLSDGTYTSTKGNLSTHESILTGKTYGTLTATTTSQKIATSLIVTVKLNDNRHVDIVLFKNKQLNESDTKFRNFARDAKNIIDFLDTLVNEHAKAVALENAAIRARQAEEKAAQKEAEKEEKKKTARKPRAKKETAATESATPDNSAISSAEAIKKFKELLDMGAITEEEYEKKKKELLGL